MITPDYCRKLVQTLNMIRLIVHVHVYHRPEYWSEVKLLARTLPEKKDESPELAASRQVILDAIDQKDIIATRNAVNRYQELLKGLVTTEKES